jgi:hypothetical protein
MIFTKLFIGEEEDIKTVGKSDGRIDVYFSDNSRVIIDSSNSVELSDTFTEITLAIKAVKTLTKRE